MIIVQLVGGLGNQLFQYVAARRLAHVHNTVLKLDISAFEKYTLHAYHLNYFNIIENIATANEIETIKGNNDIACNCLGRVIREQSFNFDPGILYLPDNVYLQGYWQSEKYFADIKHIIIKEFTVKYALDARNKEIADSINNCSSVSLHIRRGDYASNPHTNSVHGICSLEYYQRCIAEMVEAVSEPHFFVFSDDPEWVMENIKLEYPMTLIDHNGPERDYEDLRLMSMCKHNITANSTFSWWAAWLNPNPKKMIFVPERWFQNEKTDTSDLIPDNWQKV